MFWPLTPGEISTNSYVGVQVNPNIWALEKAHLLQQEIEPEFLPQYSPQLNPYTYWPL